MTSSSRFSNRVPRQILVVFASVVSLLAIASVVLLSLAREAPPSASVAPRHALAATAPREPRVAARREPDHAAPSAPSSTATSDERRLLELPREALRSVETEYAALRAVLDHSGPDRAEWTLQARQVLTDLHALPALATVRLHDVECYAAGCIVDITYPDRTTANALTEPVLHHVATWTGDHMLTGPREVPGGWAQAVILIHPVRTR